MPKVIVSKATQAVTESVRRQLMPQLDDALGALRTDVRAMRDEMRSVDAKVDALREDMLDRFERQLLTLNETNTKVIALDGKVARYMQALSLFMGPISPRALSKKRAS